MKNYYEIIGVDRNASATEIKKSFRRLANLYHPDKNPSQNAEALFKEINEAYEVLSDPVSRSQYDQSLINPQFVFQPPQPVHRDPRYRPNAYRSTGPSERRLFLESMLRFSHILFYFGCLWCFILSVDYFLPAEVLEENVVTEREFSRMLSGRNARGLTTSGGHRFGINMDELRFFPYQSTVRIYRSSLFSAVIKIENHDGSFVMNNLGSIYRNFSFAPILLLLMCVVGLVFKGGLEFHVNLGVVVFVLMILNIVFLFTSRV